MQKATYYDSSAIYSGYPYQSANGFSYDANQIQYPRASHVESEYHRPACSLQSPDGSLALQKREMVAENCDRTTVVQAVQSKVHPKSNQAQVPVSAPPPPPQSPGAATQTTSNGSNQPSAKNGSPTSASRSKQIFPWMKESRQATKQKSASSASSGIKHPCKYTQFDSYTFIFVQWGRILRDVNIDYSRSNEKSKRFQYLSYDIGHFVRVLLPLADL